MKYSGKIGFWIDDEEVRPGVWENGIKEKSYSGDILRNFQRWKSGENTKNDDVNLNNRISVIADLYLQQHLSSIKYVSFMGSNWKVNSIEIQYPRVLLEIGGVWNGIDDESQA